MFEKREVIVSATMGLCVVADITRLAADRKAPMLYYVLRAYYDTTKTAYIPVEHHEVELRRPVDAMEANEIFGQIKEEYAKDKDYVPDDNTVGEIAYVLKMKKDELIAKAGGNTDSGRDLKI